MNNTVTLKEFMTMFAPQLEKKVEETLKPVYIMQQGHEDFGSLIEPYPIQREIVRAGIAAVRINRNRHSELRIVNICG